MSVKSLAQQVAEYVLAGFSGIWIRSDEYDDAVTELAQLALDNKWELMTYDSDKGPQLLNSTLKSFEPLKPATTTPANTAGGTPSRADALSLIRALPTRGKQSSSSLLVCKNIHPLINTQQVLGPGNRSEVLSTIINSVQAGKQVGTFLIILSAVANIPAELDKQFVVVDHPLPDRDQVKTMMEQIASKEGEMPDGDELKHCLDSALGCTRSQIENATALSLVQQGKVVDSVIWDMKVQALKRSGRLTMLEGTKGFDALGGLARLKSFTLASLCPKQSHPAAQPKGVFLVGPPGVGKSDFATALGVETGRRVIKLDVAAQRGHLQGQTEANQRTDLQIIDAMGPVIVFIDEVEKVFAGSDGTTSDAGTAARVLGGFLEWRSKANTASYLVVASNDATRIPDSFYRNERIDAMFFVDVPTAQEQATIWQIYVKLYGLEKQVEQVKNMPAGSDQWTGADIRTCCRLAALLGVSIEESAQELTSMANTSRESLTALRTWAHGRCRSAAAPGLYQYTGEDMTGDNTPVQNAGQRVTRNRK